MGSMGRSFASTGRSRRWTRSRIVAAGVWLLVTGGAATWFFLVAVIEVSALFGDPPDEGRLADAAFNMLLAGLCSAAGPLGVWILRRTRTWLLAAALLFGAAFIGAALIRYVWPPS